MGFCQLPNIPNARTISFPSLVKCTLVGAGTTALVLFLTLPATALVSLSKSDIDDETVTPGFNDFSVAPALRALGKVYAISLFVGDRAVGIRAQNEHGGFWMPWWRSCMIGLGTRPPSPISSGVLSNPGVPVMVSIPPRSLHFALSVGGFGRPKTRTLSPRSF